MSNYRIGTQAGGVAGMADLCRYTDVDPDSTYQEYTEIVGQDLNGAAIEAGNPRAAWSWRDLSQAELQYFLDLLGSSMSVYVYIRTRKNTGALLSEWGNFLAIMTRPKSEPEGKIVHRNVTIEFVQLVAA